MKIQFTAPALFVQDIEKCRQFYEEILKLEVDYDFGACIQYKCGIALWKPGEEHPTHKIQNLSNSKSQVELCFETENLDEVIASFEKANINYLHPLKEEPWGQRTLRFFDPEQNLIEIGESIPCFVRRMYNEGMKAEQVADKTGVSLSEVYKMIKN